MLFGLRNIETLYLREAEIGFTGEPWRLMSPSHSAITGFGPNALELSRFPEKRAAGSRVNLLYIWRFLISPDPVRRSMWPTTYLKVWCLRVAPPQDLLGL